MGNLIVEKLNHLSGKKGRYVSVGLVMLLMVLTFTGCGNESGGSPLSILEPKVELEAGTYTGVFIIQDSPLMTYTQKILDDPTSLPEVTGENKEACEEIDLNDAETRKQIEDALAKGKATIGKEVPLTIIITKGADNVMTATAKVDFAAAFPDYECEEATDEAYELTHEPGKMTMSNSQVQENETVITLFEGEILKDGLLQGTFKMTSSNVEYKDFTGTEVLMSGTWKATKGQ